MISANFSVGLLTVSLLLIAMVGCGSTEVDPPNPEASSESAIDRRSYDLGIIGAFSEMVGVGVKKMALSATLTPEAADALEEEAEKIARRNGALTYRERDFLVTDLFPASVTEGLDVLVIYKDNTLEDYLALKGEKQALIAEGRYQGAARRDIARKMGLLLSYPDAKIDEMLAE